MSSKTQKALIVTALVVAVAAVIIAKSLPGPDEPAARQSDATEQGSAGTPILLELGSDHCVPCKMMMPILEEVKAEYAGQLTVKFIDVFKDEQAMQKYQVCVIPTQIFYDHDGKELFRHEGFFAKQDILAKWKELGVDLTRTE